MPRRFQPVSDSALFPIASALRATLQKGYSLSQLRQDALAGLVVALLALPLAMALSIAVGLPPQHGIYTAIVAGVVTALLGGSMTQVSGPTAAFVVVVAPIVAELGLRGILWSTILAGIFLLMMGTSRLGRYIHFVPYPVTTGFTAGIAVGITALALNDFFGLGIINLSGSFLHKLSLLVEAAPQFNPYELAVGMVALLVMLFVKGLTRKIPGVAVGVVAGTVAALLLQHYGIEVATIGSRFHYETAEGVMMNGIPPYPPLFHLPSMDAGALFSLPSSAELRILLAPALVIAALAALESLLSATVADSMAGTRHDPNAELNAAGIANILSGLASGIPATGAIARTATNIHSGATSPFASVFHALFILLFVMLLAPWIAYVPMAALAALLIVTAYRMSHLKQCIRILRLAPMNDRLVLLTCFLLTVFVDMVAGVTVGIVLASLLFMKRISDITEIEMTPSTEVAKYLKSQADMEHVVVYRIDGPLFFGTVEKAYDRYHFVPQDVTAILFDLERVPLIDMTGLVALRSLLQSMVKEGRDIFICGNPRITERIHDKLQDAPWAQSVRFAVTVQGALKLLKAT